MAERHLGGLAGAGEDELAAMTGGGAFHGAQAYHRAASKQDARSPLIAASFIDPQAAPCRSEEHTSELQSLMRTSYAVFRLTQKTRSATPRQLKCTHSITIMQEHSQNNSQTPTHT